MVTDFPHCLASPGVRRSPPTRCLPPHPGSQPEAHTPGQNLLFSSRKIPQKRRSFPWQQEEARLAPHCAFRAGFIGNPQPPFPTPTKQHRQTRDHRRLRAHNPLNYLNHRLPALRHPPGGLPPPGAAAARPPGLPPFPAGPRRPRLSPGPSPSTRQPRPRRPAPRRSAPRRPARETAAAPQRAGRQRPAPSAACGAGGPRLSGCLKGAAGLSHGAPLPVILSPIKTCPQAPGPTVP